MWVVVSVAETGVQIFTEWSAVPGCAHAWRCPFSPRYVDIAFRWINVFGIVGAAIASGVAVVKWFGT